MCDGEEHCAHCEELRGIHRGETAVARRHAWPTRLVVQGLDQLAAGASYADVGRWARRVTGTTRTKKIEKRSGGKKTGRVRSPASAASRNAWHIAADWVEAFAPVIWAPLDSELRDRAQVTQTAIEAARAAGSPIEYPLVILVDDVPVYGPDLDSGKSRRDSGFFILAVAETEWGRPLVEPGPATATAQLRLLRALPKSNTAAWRLVFDELGYTPDYVVADAGTGIAAAVAAHFDPARTKFVPSVWHLARAVENALSGVRGAFTDTPAGKRPIAPITEHLRKLSRRDALATTTAWSNWWDDLETILRHHRLPVDKVRVRRRNYEQALSDVIPELHRYPALPISTGGLETLISKHVHPILAMRRTAFANIERTNLLLDLVVARAHGAFDDHSRVIELIRTDTNTHGGWTVPLRAISDPRPPGGSYSSLRDTTLLASLAEQRGLT